MHILGISTLGETSAAIARDGQLLAAAEQERFNRERHTHAFPGDAIQYCLEEAGITLAEVDYVAVNYNPLLGWRWGPYLIKNLPKSIDLLKKKLKPKTSKFMSVRSKLKELDRFSRQKPIMLDHHLLHMASSFYLSPFHESAVLITDAVGEWATTTLGYGQGTRFKTFEQVNFPQSLGFFYGAITDYLGFEFDKHEGKTMGLAALGDPVYKNELLKIVKYQDRGRFLVDQTYFNYKFGWQDSPLVSDRFCKKFGPRRMKGEAFERHHLDMAASAQGALEDVIISIARYLYEQTKSSNLCIAGGVALNCVANSRILEEVAFTNLYIPPAPNDAGTSIGAIYYLYHNQLGKPRQFEMKHAYWGPEFSNPQIEDVLSKSDLSFQYIEDICAATARELNSGAIVGWFQGRMELGPRALGNRSILADPRSTIMKDKINSNIKFRESFRPFAPAILEHRRTDYFNNDHLSPFMLQSFQIKKEKQLEIPAVTHADGSGRLQTVDKETNPLYYKLIEEFDKLTGVPVLLNTSLNIRGNPVARTPEDALYCFKNSGLDVLVLGNFMLKKA